MKVRLIKAIDIAIKPSSLLLGLLCVISILSCLAIVVLPMPMLFKLTILIVIVASTGYYTLRDALRLLPWSWQRIEVSATGQLKLTNKQGEQFSPDLASTSFIHPWMIIINTQPSTYRQRLFGALPALILFADYDEQQHRQLRVWLRWWKHQEN
jgi:hypothetical protein